MDLAGYNVLYATTFVYVLIYFIVKLIFCVTGAANELQRSIMYDQTGSLISLNNELSSREEI